MKSGFTWTAVLLASASLNLVHGESDLKHEHSGDVFSEVHGGGSCLSGVLHGNVSIGETKILGGGTIDGPRCVAESGLTNT